MSGLAPAILPSSRERWLEERKRYITATDVSAICGLNPWRTPLDVYLEKSGLTEPQPETVPMRMGRMLQPVVLDLYEEKTGLAVRRYDDTELVVSSDIPWAACTPDAELVAGDRRVVEAKIVGERQAARWGEPGTDDVPEYYLVQVAWQMLVTGREAGDLAALFGGRDFAVYPIRKVDALARALVERCERFRAEHLVPGVAPEIGAGESAARYLRTLYPRDARPELLPSDERLDALAMRLANLRTLRDNYETEVEIVENLFKADIGDAAGIRGSGWLATWKKSRDSKNTDWQAVAHELADANLVRLNEAAKKHTTTKPGTRRFNFKLNTEEN